MPAPAVLKCANSVPTVLHSLVQQLVALSSPPAIHDPSLEDVLVDIEVDGLRCIVFRLPKKEAKDQIWLSPRELEIARMVAKGLPNKTIAGVLEISSWTVCTYIRRVFAKLGVASRAAMVAKLHESGLLGPLPPKPL